MMTDHNGTANTNNNGEVAKTAPSPKANSHTQPRGNENGGNNGGDYATVQPDPVAPNNEQLEVYLKSCERASEARILYWARMVPFITFQGFLLTAFALTHSGVLLERDTLPMRVGILEAGIAALGIFVSILWSLINKNSIEMLENRMNRAHQLECRYSDEYQLKISLDDMDRVFTRSHCEPEQPVAQ